MRYLLVLFLIFSTLYAKENELKKVSLQLLWLDQFQFAGYYMAKEKGFYKEAGFDVEIKKFKKGVNVAKDVVDGVSTYGVGRASLIKYDSAGKKISLLAAIFQSLPNVLLTLKSSNINSIKDFKDKTLMQTQDVLQGQLINVMLKASNISPSDIKFVEHSFNLNDLIDGKVDIYSGYLSNEPYQLRKKGIAYKSFYVYDEGLDIYSDILFTSQQNATKHPKRVEAFKEASLRGWEYAFSHIDESVNLILQKYNAQKRSREALVFEAKTLKTLAYKGVEKIGTIEVNKLQRIYDIYKILAKTKEPLDTKNLIFNTHKIFFTKKERAYLKRVGKISFCTQPDALPYSAIKNNTFIGIGAGILETATKESGVTFRLVQSSSWDDSIQKAIKRECDILPLASYSPSRTKYFNFTEVYYKEPLVIVTKKEEPYILDTASVLGKTFSIIKGNSYVETLLNRYPDLKVVYVKNIQEGLDGVEHGLYEGYIDILMSAAYTLQKESYLRLKINGQFDFTVDVSFAVRNDDPTLFSIMNKVAKNLTAEDIQQVLNRWIRVNYEKHKHYWYSKEIGSVILLLVIFFLVREYYLRKKAQENSALQQELRVLNSKLELQAYEATVDLEKAQKVAQIGSWVYDIVNKDLRWSKQTYEMFEVDPRDDGDLFAIFQSRIHPDDVEYTNRTYIEAIKNRSEYFIRHRLLLPDGKVKYVQEKCETSYNEAGEALVSHGTVQDITDKVLQEKEIKKKDAFMLHQSRLAQMGEMMSMVAHQWKQPLSAISSTEITIRMAVELEKFNLSDPKEREDFLQFLDERLSKIALYTQNLSRIITDFSNFYKPNKEVEFLSVDSVILKAFNLIKDSMHSNNIEVHFELNADKHISIYENEFMQVILNLLNNAKDQLLESATAHPRIAVTTEIRDEMIVVEIEDNGGGIKRDVIENIFDPYFSTKPEKNGTGLGLYMCKMIISEYHKGSISAENTSLGALFRIKIKNNE